MPVGRWEKLAEDERGLYVEGKLNFKTPAGAAAFEHIAHGDSTGMSIGYAVPNDGFERTPEFRLLKRIVLHEVSFVALPSESAARITNIKAAAPAPISIRDFEAALQQIGYSRREARQIATKGFLPATSGPTSLCQSELVLAGRALAELHHIQRITTMTDDTIELKDVIAAVGEVKNAASERFKLIDTTTQSVKETQAELKARLLDVEQKQARRGGGGQYTGSGGNIGEQLLDMLQKKSDGLEAMRNGHRGRVSLDLPVDFLQRKSDPLLSPGATLPQQLPGIVGLPERRLTIRDLLPTIPTTSGAVVYLQETSSRTPRRSLQRVRRSRDPTWSSRSKPLRSSRSHIGFARPFRYCPTPPPCGTSSVGDSAMAWLSSRSCNYSRTRASATISAACCPPRLL